MENTQNKEGSRCLVIMAAGLGSRFGGDKQITGVGPEGEILMEYSIYDAVCAGFDQIALIIKPQMREEVQRLCEGMLAGKKTPQGRPVTVSYVYQDYDSVPAFYSIPVERTKPFGTVHALLCARDAVKVPFIVINADDYYGRDAYSTAYEALGRMPAEGYAAMVGYRLSNTVSENGTVTRGLCAMNGSALTGVTETYRIRLLPDGTITNEENGAGTILDPAETVSMNFWCFMPSIFAPMAQYFDDFLHALPAGEVKKECLLPVMCDRFLHEGSLSIEVLHTSARWFGMTYREDRDTVAEELRRLHENGTYPKALRG